MDILSFLRLGTILAISSVGACKPSQPIPAIAEQKPGFEKQVYFDSESGAMLTLISSTECEFQGVAEDAPIVLAEYSRDGNRLRVVVKEQLGHANVLYFEITEKALVMERTKQIFNSTSPVAANAIINKKRNAQRILNDLRLLDSGMDMWAIEQNKRSGDTVSSKDVARYLKADTRLRKSCATGSCLDSLGNPFIIETVDTLPALSRASFDQLSDIAPADYWSPYIIK